MSGASDDDKSADRSRCISAAEAARRLGVKRETVYAYVSRGLLSSERVPGMRETRLDPAEVARLASRHRGGGRAGSLEVVVDSALTRLDPTGKLSYRGWDVVDASRSALFEHVAMWLWGRSPAEIEAAGVAFETSPELIEPARQAVALAGTSAGPIDRYLLALAASAPADPLRHSRDPYGIANRAARMIATLVESLPLATRGRPRRALAGSSRQIGSRSTESQQTGSPPSGPRPSGPPPSGPRPIAERLWVRLAPAAPSGEEARVLNAALVLLADHELATSTLAARVAASTWADPYRVVTAAMATLGGPLHGGVGDQVAGLLREATASGVGRAVGERLRAGERLPGFGHMVYQRRDPRGDALLDQVRTTWAGHEVVDAVNAVVSAVAAEHPETFPNVDLALGTLIAAAGMIDGSAEAIFATARIAGWIAHGIEEYQHRLRYRTRAAYTGAEEATPLPTIRTLPF